MLIETKGNIDNNIKLETKIITENGRLKSKHLDKINPEKIIDQNKQRKESPVIETFGKKDKVRKLLHEKTEKIIKRELTHLRNYVEILSNNIHEIKEENTIKSTKNGKIQTSEITGLMNSSNKKNNQNINNYQPQKINNIHSKNGDDGNSYSHNHKIKSPEIIEQVKNLDKKQEILSESSNRVANSVEKSNKKCFNRIRKKIMISGENNIKKLHLNDGYEDLKKVNDFPLTTRNKNSEMVKRLTSKKKVAKIENMTKQEPKEEQIIEVNENATYNKKIILIQSLYRGHSSRSKLYPIVYLHFTLYSFISKIRHIKMSFSNRMFAYFFKMIKDCKKNKKNVLSKREMDVPLSNLFKKIVRIKHENNETHISKSRNKIGKIHIISKIDNFSMLKTNKITKAYQSKDRKSNVNCTELKNKIISEPVMCKIPLEKNNKTSFYFNVLNQERCRSHNTQFIENNFNFSIEKTEQKDVVTNNKIQIQLNSTVNIIPCDKKFNNYKNISIHKVSSVNIQTNLEDLNSYIEKRILELKLIEREKLTVSSEVNNIEFLNKTIIESKIRKSITNSPRPQVMQSNMEPNEVKKNSLNKTDEEAIHQRLLMKKELTARLNDKRNSNSIVVSNKIMDIAKLLENKLFSKEDCGTVLHSNNTVIQDNYSRILDEKPILINKKKPKRVNIQIID